MLIDHMLVDQMPRRSHAGRSLHHEPLRARSPSRTATSGPGLWLPRIARLGQIGTSLWQHMLRFRGGNAAGSAREVPKMQQRREKARELRVRGPVSHLRPVSCRRRSLFAPVSVPMRPEGVPRACRGSGRSRTAPASAATCSGPRTRGSPARRPCRSRPGDARTTRRSCR